MIIEAGPFTTNFFLPGFFKFLNRFQLDNPPDSELFYRRGLFWKRHVYCFLNRHDALKNLILQREPVPVVRAHSNDSDWKMMNSPSSETENKPKRVVRFDLAPSTMFTMVAIIAGFWLLFRLLPVLLVLIAAFFIMGTLNPAVQWLERRRVSRPLSIAIVFVSMLALTLVIGFLTMPTLMAQASAMLEQAPVLQAQIAEKLSNFPLGQPLAKWLRNFKWDQPSGGTGPTVVTYSFEAVELIAYGITAIFLALYMMIDRDRLRGGLFAVVPRAHHIRLSRMLMNLETIVGAYIRGQVITSAVIGVFILVLLVCCGVENAVTLAVFGALADILPYIGVFFPMAAAVVTALPHGSVITMVVLCGMLIYMEFESRVLVPRVYGQALRLPSTVVLFSLLAGGVLMGIVGALLSLPFAAAVMMVIEEMRVKLPGEQKLPTDEVIREDDDRAVEEYERRTEGVPAEQSAAIAVEIAAVRLKEENEILHKTTLHDTGAADNHAHVK